MKTKAFNYIQLTLDWTVFLVLICSALYSVNEVWNDYNVKKTSLNYEELPVDRHPTVTICSGKSYYESETWMGYLLGIDFNITIYANSQRYEIVCCCILNSF